MGYVDDVLQPGETVRMRTNYHWVELIPGLALLGLALVSYWWAGRPNTFYGLWMTLAVLLLAGALILLVRSGFQRFITEIAITDRRVIFKTGFISRETDEMPLNKVENVEVKQTILGRLLDYGDIDLQGTGRGGIGSDKLRRIASPLQFRNSVLAAE